MKKFLRHEREAWTSALDLVIATGDSERNNSNSSSSRTSRNNNSNSSTTMTGRTRRSASAAASGGSAAAPLGAPAEAASSSTAAVTPPTEGGEKRKVPYSSAKKPQKKKHHFDGDNSANVAATKGAMELDDSDSSWNEGDSIDESEAMNMDFTSVEEERNLDALKEQQLLLQSKKDISNKEMMNMILEMNIAAKERELKLRSTICSMGKSLRALRRQVQGLEGEIEELRKKALQPAVASAKRAILVRGLPDDEEGFDTQQAVDLLLQKLECNSTGIESSKRVGLSQVMRQKLGEQKKPIRRPVLIRFTDVASKSAMFRCCPKLKGWQYSVRLANDVPWEMREWNAVLEDEAKAIRSSGDKTRIVWKGNELSLQARKKEEKTWHDVNMESNI